jgi:hypothetical protein
VITIFQLPLQRHPLDGHRFEILRTSLSQDDHPPFPKIALPRTTLKNHLDYHQRLRNPLQLNLTEPQFLQVWHLY